MATDEEDDTIHSDGEENPELTFADAVWHRVVQCIQEAMLTGTDVSDSLRQIRVVESDDYNHVLVLSPGYEKQVIQMHEKMLERARELQAQTSMGQFLVRSNDDDTLN